MTPSTVRLALTEEQRKKPKAWHQTYFFNKGQESCASQVEALKKKCEDLKSGKTHYFSLVLELQKENEALKRILDDVRKLLMIKK